MWASPLSLTGKSVTLVPLSRDHASDLAEAAADGALHQLW